MDDDVDDSVHFGVVVLGPRADDLFQVRPDLATMPHPFRCRLRRRRLGADRAVARGPVPIVPIRSRPEVVPVALRG
jgi:hypothetical protein